MRRCGKVSQTCQHHALENGLVSLLDLVIITRSNSETIEVAVIRAGIAVREESVHLEDCYRLRV